jgi:Uma2 family endonuclease
MTADEFFDFVHRPENQNRVLELVRGEVIELSQPTRVHGRICINVAYPLERYARKIKKGYVTCNDSGVVLKRDTVRGADVAYYDDVQSFEELPEKWGDTVPKLAVEVISPNDRADYINCKITDYLKSGVDLVWVVDPEARTVTIYSRHEGPVQLTEKDTITGGDVLPGFRCKVAEFFVMPEETKATPKKPKRKR